MVLYWDQNLLTTDNKTFFAKKNQELYTVKPQAGGHYKKGK